MRKAGRIIGPQKHTWGGNLNSRLVEKLSSKILLYKKIPFLYSCELPASKVICGLGCRCLEINQHLADITLPMRA